METWACVTKVAYMHLKIHVFEPLVYVHTWVFKGSQQYC